MKKNILLLLSLLLLQIIVIAQNVGIGTTTPNGELHVTKLAPVPVINYTGTGVNDLSQNNSGYNGTGTTNYYVRVSNDGPNPQKFQWSNDNVSWSVEASMTVAPFLLNNNVTISFGAVTGHVFGATWSWSVQQNFPDGLIVKNGRVGVGTSSPNSNAQLDISSNNKGILIPRTSTTTRLTIPAVKGLLIYDTTTNSFWSSDGTNWTESINNTTGWGTKGNTNTNPSINFIGTTDNQPLRFRLNNNWAGEWNRANRNFSIGNGALQNLTAGNGNIAIGSGSMFGHSNPVGIVAIGDSALANLSGGIGGSNTAVGQRALYANSNGFNNTAIGMQALQLNTTGNNNVALGAFALASNVDGDRNIAIGRNALNSNTIGNAKIAIGTAALASGGGNIAIGDSALFSDDYCCNLAVGDKALKSMVGFNYYNTAIGNGAMSLVPSSIGSTAIGDGAMRYTGGYYVTALGAGANAYTGLSFATAVGANASVGCNNCLVLGGNSVTDRTKVGINQSSPFTDLHIVQQSDNGADKTRGVRLQRSVNSNQWRTLIDPSNNYIFEYNNSLYSYIEPVGGAFVNPSDERLKKDIEPLDDVLNKLLQLQPKKYNYTVTDTFSKAKLSGFLTQDVEKLFPDFVHTGQNGYKGIAYHNFGIIAVKAIQEQQIILEDLKKENAVMKKELQLIKSKLGL